MWTLNVYGTLRKNNGAYCVGARLVDLKFDEALFTWMKHHATEASFLIMDTRINQAVVDDEILLICIIDSSFLRHERQGL